MAIIGYLVACDKQ